MKLNKITKIAAFLAIGTMLWSCETPKLGYFQGVESGTVQQLSDPSIIKLQTGDKLSILVGSKDPGLAYLFNLQIVGRYRTTRSDASLTTSQVACYTVDPEGNIDFPVLGKLNLVGMTRSEVAGYIKGQLIGRELLKDPVVTVDFLDLSISVLGEVHTPGRYGIDHDKITLIEAIGKAGDLTIYGKRNNVLVQRIAGNKLYNYRVDLTDPQSLYSSPVYYLQQGDLVYVEPNDKKARESTVNGNTLRTPTFWMSVTSLLASLCVIIFR